MVHVHSLMETKNVEKHCFSRKNGSWRLVAGRRGGECRGQTQGDAMKDVASTKLMCVRMMEKTS